MTEQVIIFFQIVFIDLVLAGDNAIIIGMVASQFDYNSRKKIIFWGIGAAIILRIVFTLITAYLLQINGLKFIGGLLLLYIAYKLYKDVIKNESSNERKLKNGKSNFFKAIMTVIIADISMSLDNVLGVAGAAKDHYILLVFGLVLSILLMATVANIISKWIKKYKWIGWLGLLSIVVVAVELIYSDLIIFFINMYLKKINLKNKTALVTGAGKGIGMACSIALAEAGANLIIISRTQKDLDKVSKIIKKLKLNVFPMPAM